MVSFDDVNWDEMTQSDMSSENFSSDASLHVLEANGIAPEFGPAVLRIPDKFFSIAG